MKSSIFVYAGTFSPPHIGHYQIVQKFASAHNKSLWIVCSENPDKTNNWFTPEECKRMWLSYDLPSSVVVLTLAEFKRDIVYEPEQSVDSTEIILVRGIRSERDFEYEKTVMMYNKEEFGIEQFLYIFGDNLISSTDIRKKAWLRDSKIDEVTPYVYAKLQEYIGNELVNNCIDE